ncbi:MAG: vitamin K epoxide reductase family protein [Mucilaginibacter sp.]
MLTLRKQENAEAVTIALLSKLKANISNESVQAELERHPEYPSLLSISDVLRSFGIQNQAFTTAPDQLKNIPCPFIIHTRLGDGDFLFVNSISGDKVLVSNEMWRKRRISLNKLKDIFTGVVLTASVTVPANGSNLPNILSKFRLTLILTGILITLFFGLLIDNHFFANMGIQKAILAISKSIGLIITALLLIQSIEGDNPFIQKLCSIGKKGDCQAILASPGANLVNGVSWSEVGFFYFFATWLMTLFSSSAALMHVIAILSLLSLPYTFYSIYYQAKIARYWCVLCCAVQLLLWIEFLALKVFILPLSFRLTSNEWAILIVTFLLPILLWAMVKPVIIKARMIKPLKNQLRRFKYNTELFNSLLISQPKFTLPSENWSITLGNTEADNNITVVTNPYCTPCANMHKMLDQLLEERDDIQARIVFATEDNLSDIKIPISRHFMALNANYSKNIVREALSSWYGQHEKNYEAWSKTYPVDAPEKEFHKLDEQRAWCEMAGITGTPTLFLNGHRLPDLYELPDLRYILG